MYYIRILTFMFQVLFSPNETVYRYFRVFFTSWIRIQKAYLYADPEKPWRLPLVVSMVFFWSHKGPSFMSCPELVFFFKPRMSFLSNFILELSQIS